MVRIALYTDPSLKQLLQGIHTIVSFRSAVISL